MSDSNGNGAPTVEEGRDWLEAVEYEMREAGGAGGAAGAGWVIPGVDPYREEWQVEDLAEKYKTCPDATSGTVISARLVEGEINKRTGRVRSDTLRYTYAQSQQKLDKLRESAGWQDMREWNWSPDPFAYGEQQVMGGGAGALGAYIPLWPGPVTRQLYWQDYFAMSAKAFEAYNHDPISWRCVHMKQEFALGKGLQARVTYSSGTKAGQTHEKADEVWQEFWKRNKMDNRLDMLARDLSIMGEQFMRYFVKNKKVTIRSVDPASIYDLITDPEDHETVFAYHQQFQTPYQLYPPNAATPPTGVQSPDGPTQPGTATRFIIRQILPQEIDHYRINTGAYERRGRSDLFPALGWIRRLRDYLTSHVVRADMLSRVCWDLEVQGNVAAIQALRGLLFPNGQPPPPGTIFGHNQSAKLNTIAPQGAGTGGSRWDPILDALVTMVANSIGLPKDWLGFGMTTTRASALVATEPAARSLEELQGTIELILHDCFDRVMAAAGISDADVEFTFPSIATEDRSSKLKDLAFMESNGYLSKPTAASIAAKEMGITGYDYEEEQGLIADEFPEPEMEDIPGSEPDPVTGKKPQRPVQGDGKIRRPMISAQYRQAPKLDPTKSPSQEDEPPGLLVPTDGSAPPTSGDGSSDGGPPPPPGTQPTRGGVPADENAISAGGAKSIKQDMKVKEGVLEVTPEALHELLDHHADSVVRAMRERRRRPDDPRFQRAASRYREESAANLRELVGAAVEGTGTSEAGHE